MDGFDDLLPSRDGLQNPFEDPFAKARSSSPDPWASFGQATVPSFNEEAFAFGGSTSPTVVTHNAFADADIGGFQDDRDEEHEAERTPATAPAAVPDPHEEEGAVDPLDTAAFNAAEAAAEAEEAAAAAAAPLSRGFRESVSTETEEPPTPEPSSEQKPARVPTPPADEPIKPASPPPANRTSVGEVPNRTVGHVSRASTASFSSGSHGSAVKAEPAAFNPLDKPVHTLERSIAGLSIGGEALGGWQGSGGWQTQTTYTPPEPPSHAQNVSDDDDDDDKPIAQTIAAKAAQRAASVSLTIGMYPPYMPSSWNLGNKPAASTSTPAGAKKENGIQPVFVITVDDPQRVGDPIRAYTMYTVHTKVRLPCLSDNHFHIHNPTMFRQHLPCTRSRRSLCFADTLTSFGYMKHFP